jgi:5'-nucleotidase / UDP-sugar diphosphatase
MKTNLLTGLCALAIGGLLQPALGQYSLTILHNNDGESRLINYSSNATEYGGVARFATLFDETRSFYQGIGHGVVSIFAGDSFLSGPQFQASLDSGLPGSRTFYDALAISRIGYDVSVIGNHEFDFGPSVLAEFITAAQTHNTTTYLSANLDFSGEASLNALVIGGQIAPSKLIDVSTSAGPVKVGVIGAVTESLPFVSSPGAVSLLNTANAINAQVASLKTAGAQL